MQNDQKKKKIKNKRSHKEPVLLESSYMDPPGTRGKVPYILIVILIFAILSAFWKRHLSDKHARENPRIERVDRNNP